MLEWNGTNGNDIDEQGDGAYNTLKLTYIICKCIVVHWSLLDIVEKILRFVDPFIYKVCIILQ